MIDYSLLGKSVEFYSSKGFQRVEVPWTVTREISNITKPIGAKEFRLLHENDKVLVASAEQSFLYQYAKGFLPKGKFQAITPCFRFENFDCAHTKYFMKNELIITDFGPDEDAKHLLDQMISWAENFFRQHVPDINLLRITSPDMKSFDIEYDGTEIGSYGIRTCPFLKWIYGTGLAEPRFSNTIKRKNYELPS